MSDERVEMSEIINAIRRRPAMYIGGTSYNGIEYMVLGTVISFISNFEFSRATLEITGPTFGTFRFDDIKTPFKDSFAQELFLRNVQGGCCPIAFLALSNRAFVKATDAEGNLLFQQEFEKGRLIASEISQIEFNANQLEISFEFDPTLIALDQFINWEYLLEPLRRLAALAPPRTLILDHPVGKDRSHLVFRFENGLRDFIAAAISRSLSGVCLETYLKQAFEDYAFEVAFFFNNVEFDEPALHSFVNFENIHGQGTHLDALLGGIASAFRRYVAKHNLRLDISEFTTTRHVFSTAKLKRVLVAAIHLQMDRPTFEGSTRCKLVSRNVIPGIKQAVADALFENMESNPQQVEAFLRHFRDVEFDFSGFFKED